MATYRVPVLGDFAWQPPVADRATAHTGDPEKGTRYIVTTEATGQFTGQEDDIATAVVSAPSAASDWIFDTPTEGWTTYVKDEDVRYIFDGAAWAMDSGDGAGSQVLVLESEMSQVESRILLLESEMSDVNSNLLVEKSTVNDVSEALSAAISDLLVEKSTVNAVSEALSVGLSRILVLESEMSDINSNLLVEKSTVNDVSEALLAEQSTVNDVSEALSAGLSRILVLESEMSQVESRTLVLESEMSVVEADKQDKGTYVAEYGAIEFTI